MKKLLVLSLVAAMAIFGTNAFATPPCNGPACEQVLANPTGNGEIHGTITIVPNGQNIATGASVQHPDSNSQGGNLGTADVIFTSNAAASGKDVVYYSGKDVHYHKGRVDEATGYWLNPQTGDVEEHEWTVTHQTGFFTKTYYHGVWKYLGKNENIIEGEATAVAHNQLTLTSDVDVISNSPQTSGLAYTKVHATTTLDIDGYAKAEGTDGCLQEASVDVAGSVSAYAYGNSFSGNFAGAYAEAGGSGLTTVSFVGHEQDASNYGGWFSPNEAYVDFDSTITVDQKGFFASYVKPDGTFAGNLAYVGGGNARLDLGSDGSFLGFVYDRDDIQLTGITASGEVGQQSRAIGGGAVASGDSNAYFSGANGSVETIPGNQVWCFTEASPGQTANVGGYAFAAGYNNVNVQGNMIQVTSHQVAYATTGNSGPVID